MTVSIGADTHDQSFSAVIHGRRSVRAYDPNFKISREEMKALLGEAILAPSWGNLQPWRFLVIDDEKLKLKLLPIANNQQQVADASAVIAVLANLEYYKQAKTIYGRAFEAGFMPEDRAKLFVERITAKHPAIPSEMRTKIVSTDAGLVSMALMLAARARGLDTVPMGGYDVDNFKETFGISDRYLPIILIAIGKAVKQGHPTVRLSVDEVTSFNQMTNE
ncbi:nitroreductase family protein [Paenibacillus sp. J23TS9]|uniref:nitroreductase family protein n=1 Tax=Paenibacillus sp. J23TS9 TaxID=2807193 RepID=UPI001FD197FC|nr:nitroreductase family protein [Paenibacillus sp. J23TS9]